MPQPREWDGRRRRMVVSWGEQDCSFTRKRRSDAVPGINPRPLNRLGSTSVDFAGLRFSVGITRESGIAPPSITTSVHIKPLHFVQRRGDLPLQ